MTRQSADSADQSRLVRGVRRAVRTDASAYAYSILITTVFGLVNLRDGPPTVGRLFAFAMGATFGFALWEAAVSRGFRIHIREEKSDVVLVGTAMAPVSVGASLGLALGVGQMLSGIWAWSLVPLTATIVYVALTGAQLAVARIYEERHPPDESE